MLKKSTKYTIGTTYDKQNTSSNHDELFETTIYDGTVKQIISFTINTKTLTRDEVDELRTISRYFKDNKNLKDFFLQVNDISTSMTSTKPQMVIKCECHDQRRTKDYFESENRSLFEIEMQTIYILEMFDKLKNCIYSLHLSFSDISFMLKETGNLPFPTIVLTPYSYLKPLIDKYKKRIEENKEDERSSLDIEEENRKQIYKMFGKILQCFDMKRSEINGKELIFEKEVEYMKQGKDIVKLLKKNEEFQQLVENRKLMEFNPHDYTVKKNLGKGTYGSVMLVQKNDGNDTFAMKECAKVALSELTKESVVLQHIKHVNVISFYGFNTKQGYISKELRDGKYPHGFMLMECCPCGDLRQYMMKNYRNKPLEKDTLNLLFGQIARVCSFINRRKVMHRDLKLENILIKQTEPFVWLKLSDFGTAICIDDKIKSFTGTTTTNDLRILLKQEYDSTSDLYSIGCMLYALLYGKYPCEDHCVVGTPTVFIKMIKEKKYDFKEIQNEKNENFDDAIECCKLLLKYEDNEMNWEIFNELEYVKTCIDYVKTVFDDYKKSLLGDEE